MSLFHKELKEEVLDVDGMMCQHCASRVVEGLKKIKVNAKVDLENKQVQVAYDESKITKEDIKKAINDLGYKCK